MILNCSKSPMAVAGLFLICWTSFLFADDGVMLRIGTQPAPVMSGPTELAKLPPSARIWSPRQNGDQWFEVRIPTTGKTGYVNRRFVQRVGKSDSELARLQTAYAAYDRYTEQRETNPTAALAAVEQCLNIETEVLGDDHPDVAVTLTALASLLTDGEQRDRQTQLYERAIAIRKEHFGIKHVLTIEALTEASEAALNRNDVDAAATYRREALAVAESFPASEDADAHFQLGTLRMRLFYADHRPERAIDQADALAAFARRQYGTDLKAIAERLEIIADTAWDHDDYVTVNRHGSTALATYIQAGENDAVELGDMHNRLGVAAIQLNQLDEAESQLRDAINAFQSVSENSLYNLSFVVYNQALLAYARGDLRRAGDLLNEYLRLSEQSGDFGEAELAGRYGEAAAVASNGGDSATARSLYRQAIDRYRRVRGSEREVIENLNFLGLDRTYVGAVDDAEKSLNEALKLCRSIASSQDLEATTRLNLGNLYVVDHRYDEAKEHLGVVKQLLIDLGENADPYTFARTLVLEADLHRYRENMQPAIEKYEAAYQMFNQHFGENDLDTAATLEAIGLCYYFLDDASKALEYCQRSLAAYRTVANSAPSQSVVSLETDVGEILQFMGRYGDARIALDRATDELQRIPNASNQRKMHLANSQANLRWEMADYDGVVEFCGEVIQLGESAGDADEDALGSAHLMLGNVMVSRKQISRAEHHANEAQRVHQHLYPDREDSTLLTLFGKIALSQGKLENARRFMERAAQVSRQRYGDSYWTANSLTELAIVETNQNRFDAAQKNFAEASRLFETIGMGTHRVSTEVGFRRVVNCKQRGDSEETFREMNALRRRMRRLHAEVLPTLSQREQAMFLEENERKCFEAAVSLAVEDRASLRHRVLSAAWLINGKAISQQALAESALLAGPETVEMVEKLRSVRARLASLNSPIRVDSDSKKRQGQIAALEAEQQQLTNQIAAAGTGFSGRDPWISAGQLQEELRSGTVMVNIVRYRQYDVMNHEEPLGTAQYAAWIIPAVGENEIQIVPLGDADEIDRLATELSLAMEASETGIRNKGLVQAEAELQWVIDRLSKSVVEPLMPYLENAKEVIFSPDGKLWLAPWSALRAGDRYLVEKFVVRYATSGRELARPKTSRVGVSNPVIVAAPNYNLSQNGVNGETRRSVDPGSFQFNVGLLPNTEVEARSIQPALAKYTRRTPELILHGDATQRRLQSLFRPSVLVIATHGFTTVAVSDENTQSQSESVNPLLRCGLLLAGCNVGGPTPNDEADDGVLSGLEVVGIDLRGTELVVLSACQTGLGEIRDGEGIAGMRQAFQLAGASGIASTLWSIPDRETAHLMTGMFEAMAAGNQPATALRDAQVMMIDRLRKSDKVAHPFYWAAFTLTGN